MDEDDDEIYFLDTRNAPYVMSRSQNGRAGTGRAVAVRPGSRFGSRTSAMSRYGTSYPSRYTAGTVAGEFGIGAGLGGLFGGTSPGQLVDLIAQIFAAVMPLPTPPTTTGDAATDIGNSITYQSSLATYAKRDEQVRTVGNLVMKLIG